MIKLGITGGIGAGKTTASTFFKKKGAVIFNADKEAKNHLKKSITLQHKIINALGNKVTETGKLDFKRLADVAFNSPIDQQILNGLLWPEVYILIENAGITAKQQGCKLFVVDAALLIEAGFTAYFDHVLLVIAEKYLRIHRAIKRKNLPLEQIQKRMRLQMDEDEKRKHSTYIVENNGDLNQLYSQLKKFYSTQIDK